MSRYFDEYHLKRSTLNQYLKCINPLSMTRPYGINFFPVWYTEQFSHAQAHIHKQTDVYSVMGISVV